MRYKSIFHNLILCDKNITYAFYEVNIHGCQDILESSLSDLNNILLFLYTFRVEFFKLKNNT